MKPPADHSDPRTNAPYAGRPARGARVAVVIPQFPQQTHIAWWRVMQQMAWWGAETTMTSTRRPASELECHEELIDEARHTLYLWPPRPARLAAWMLTRPASLIRGLRYLAALPESGLIEKLKNIKLLLPAAELARAARARRFDAIFVHSCADAAHVAALSRRMGGPPYALRLGGDLEVYGKDHAAKMAEAEFVAAGAAAYVPRVIDECGVSADRAFWTWVGVDCRAFTPREREPGLPIDPDALHVVTVARLTDTKGHVDGLEAIAQLRERGVDIRHTIAGRGPEEGVIRQKIAQLGLDDRVTLTGALDQAGVVSLLRSADVFLLCSYGMGESTPAVVSEAMACGVPAVCTVIGGTMDMIDNGVDGLLIPQRDPDAIAAALASLASDPDRLKMISAAALAGSARFDCRLTARRVLAGFGFVCQPPASTNAIAAARQPVSSPPPPRDAPSERTPHTPVTGSCPR